MKSIIDTLGVIKNAVVQYSKETGQKTSVALIGGHAVIFSGVERTTLDVDVCFHSESTESGGQFYKFLKGHLPKRFTHRFVGASKDPSDPLKHDIIVINDDNGEYPRIDILIASYKWEVEGLERASNVAGLSFPIMPLPYLLAMKLMPGGAKDDLDVMELLKIMRKVEIEAAKSIAKMARRDKKLSALIKKLE